MKYLNPRPWKKNEKAFKKARGQVRCVLDVHMTKESPQVPEIKKIEIKDIRRLLKLEH